MMTFRHRDIVSLIFCWALVIAVSGCGQDPLPVQPVSGLVTYKGEPLANAAVTFATQDENGRSAPGVTREDGTFELTTGGARKPGALAGEYIVYIVKEYPVDATGKRTTAEKIAAAMERLPENISSQPRMVSEIPIHYSDSRSPLRATVKKGKNDFNFDLKD
jgi:hypothetical protein